jgi:hypothetical protein
VSEVAEMVAAPEQGSQCGCPVLDERGSKAD